MVSRACETATAAAASTAAAAAPGRPPGRGELFGHGLRHRLGVVIEENERRSGGLEGEVGCGPCDRGGATDGIAVCRRLDSLDDDVDLVGDVLVAKLRSHPADCDRLDRLEILDHRLKPVEVGDTRTASLAAPHPAVLAVGFRLVIDELDRLGESTEARALGEDRKFDETVAAIWHRNHSRENRFRGWRALKADVSGSVCVNLRFGPRGAHRFRRSASLIRRSARYRAAFAWCARSGFRRRCRRVEP